MKKDDPLILLREGIKKYREYLEDPEVKAITVTMSASTATELVHLLERMEEKAPDTKRNSYGWRFDYCPSCKRELVRPVNFCEMCGQAVNFDAKSASDGGGQEGGAGPEG